MSLDFVVIDVETANPQWGSICAFGAVEVVGGEVLAVHSWLSRPPEHVSWFDPFHTLIHGIRPEMVEGAPSFSESLDRLLAIIGDRPVLAHNATFDVGQIRQACSLDGLIWPRLTYACTIVLSRRSLDLPSYSLPYVCDALGIAAFDHHDAGEDARATAELALYLARQHGADSVEELAAAVSVLLGNIWPDEWRGCVATHPGGRSHWDWPAGPNPAADPDHPLFGKTIVFTGGLGIVRREAAAAVARLGATPDDGVTKRTDFLVIGDGFTGRSPSDFHTGKAAKAVKLRAKGQPIEVLTEADLVALLQEPTTSGTRSAQGGVDAGAVGASSL